MLFIISALLVFFLLRLVVSIKQKRKDYFVFLALIYNSIFSSFATVPERYTVFGLNAAQALAISLLIGLLITAFLIFLCVKLVKRREAIYDIKSLSAAVVGNVILCILNVILLSWEL